VRAYVLRTCSAEALAQMERDMKAFGRFSSGDTYLYNPNLPSRLPNILARTLVLAAEVDEIIPRQYSEAYARLIPEVMRAAATEAP
jgi:pimeloyl-ACP methyl ester carboxylesterase